jgi:hypothetical protein
MARHFAGAGDMMGGHVVRRRALIALSYSATGAAAQGGAYNATERGGRDGPIGRTDHGCKPKHAPFQEHVY